MFGINEDIEKKVIGEGTTRKILTYSENLMLCELTFKKGAVGAMHSHPHEQIGYIVSGSLEVIIGDEKRILKAGDTYQTAPDVLHGVVALEDTKLLDVFNPMRKDFL